MRGRSPEERRDVRRRDESSRRFVAISHVRTVCVFGSRDASRFASEPDSRCVKISLEKARLARHVFDVDIRALEAPSGPPPRATCAARRARRLPSASRAHPNLDEYGRRVGRRRPLRRPRAPRRAQELRRRRGSPGIGRRARRPPPRSRCVPPGSPTSGRGDAAWTSSATLPSIVPRARGGRSAPRGPDRARRPTPTAQIRRTSSESVLSLSRSRRAASVRSASSPPAARAHSLSNAPP